MTNTSIAPNRIRRIDYMKGWYLRSSFHKILGWGTVNATDFKSEYTICITIDHVIIANDSGPSRYISRALTIYVRKGKWGDISLPASNDYASTLKKYLAVRPPLEIDRHQALFYTDYGWRWDRRDIRPWEVTRGLIRRPIGRRIKLPNISIHQSI